MTLKNIIFALSVSFVASCAGDLLPQDALSTISAQDEFQEPIYAPFHLVPEVLTGDDKEEPQKYIDRKFGDLASSGLVQAKMGGSNSWRTVLTIELTEKGRALQDVSRTVDDMIYIQACQAVADSVISLTAKGGDTIICCYQITQHQITPFGRYLGFVEGRTHQHERTFVRGAFSWNLLPL